jgi:hypothetical protein
MQMALHRNNKTNMRATDLADGLPLTLCVCLVSCRDNISSPAEIKPPARRPCLIKVTATFHQSMAAATAVHEAEIAAAAINA